jgi:2-hydroxychromene-2-carboxylate isomerase
MCPALVDSWIDKVSRCAHAVNSSEIERTGEGGMAAKLDFYFDYGSPNAYIAHVRLPEILRRTGAALVPRLMLLGGVFQATGNVSPATNKLKSPNLRRDMTRYINKYRVPFQMNPHFPVNTLKLMRGAVVAEEEGVLERYSDAAFAAMWREGLKMDDEAVFTQRFDAAGLDGKRLLARSSEEAIKGKLKTYTEEAVARGVFGAPTFFVGDEMFFGQDRLDFVEEALLGRSFLTAG